MGWQALRRLPFLFWATFSCESWMYNRTMNRFLQICSESAAASLLPPTHPTPKLLQRPPLPSLSNSPIRNVPCLWQNPAIAPKLSRS